MAILCYVVEAVPEFQYFSYEETWLNRLKLESNIKRDLYVLLIIEK